MRNELTQNQDHSVQQFGEQDARKLVEDMLLSYGKRFTDQWSGLKKGQVIDKFVQKLSGITFEQFNRGLIRLETSAWPPSVNEFKDWCLGKYEYQSHDEAWLQALTYEKQNRSHEINKFAKQAFDEVVKPYGYLGSTDTFYKVYSSVYKRIISEAKERNEADELLEAIAQCGFTGDDPSHKPVTNDIARQQLENLKRKLNVRNREIPKPQKIEVNQAAKRVQNEWPDPFDNPNEYQAMKAKGFNRVGGEV